MDGLQSFPVKYWRSYLNYITLMRCRHLLPILAGAYCSSMTKQRLLIAWLNKLLPVKRVKMRQIVRNVLHGEGIIEWDISLAFVDNPTIHRVNKRYLNHDEPTDVLTFPLSELGSKKLVGKLV